MSLKSSLSAVASVLLLHAGVAQATVPTFEPTPSESKTILVQTKNNPEAFYETAKQELPEDYYQVYRIIDRMARANQLDNLPWRIWISPSYEVNAFAGDTNLVALFRGLLEQIDGDPHAMACVVLSSAMKLLIIPKIILLLVPQNGNASYKHYWLKQWKKSAQNRKIYGLIYKV